MLQDRCHLIGIGSIMGVEGPVGLGAEWRTDELHLTQCNCSEQWNLCPSAALALDSGHCVTAQGGEGGGNPDAQPFLFVDMDMFNGLSKTGGLN